MVLDVGGQPPHHELEGELEAVVSVAGDHHSHGCQQVWKPVGGQAGEVILLVGAGFGGISMATSLALRQRESVIGMNQVLVLPAMFLSTALLPESLLPGWIATAAGYNPANWAAVAAQEVMLRRPIRTGVWWRAGSSYSRCSPRSPSGGGPTHSGATSGLS